MTKANRVFVRTTANVVLLTASITASITACSRAGRGDGSLVGHATMRNAAGETIGTARVSSDGKAVTIDMRVKGLTSGAHGVHLHMFGKCEGPTFMSAGSHINPSGARHGAKNPNGPHAGDLPNATGDAETHYVAKTMRVTIDGGAAAIFDADGTAIVIHAAPDDEMTDPTGNSGARIACGVIERG